MFDHVLLVGFYTRASFATMTPRYLEPDACVRCIHIWYWTKESSAGWFVFLSKNDPIPRQIIRHVMSSAAEAEPDTFFIIAQELSLLQNSLEETGWPQPCIPVQTDNSTAISVTNKTIVPKRAKSMDMRFHWICCHELQGQTRYFWDKGSHILSKINPEIYHESKLGSWYWV